MKPILFNTEMVKAILDGRKTQTRRVIKVKIDHIYKSLSTGEEMIYFLDEKYNKLSISSFIEKFSKYKIGDVLWVREPASVDTVTSTYDNTEVNMTCTYLSDGTMRIINVPTRFNKNNVSPKWIENKQGIPNGCIKELARIFLKVTDVRVERLQDIRGDDILDEGYPLKCVIKDEQGLYVWWRSVWDLTSKDGYKWEDNPYVFVYTFDIVDKPDLRIEAKAKDLDTYDYPPFRTLFREQPKKSGYYYVIWERGDEPTKVYLWDCREIYSDDGEPLWNFGTDEHDDPESVTIDIREPWHIQWCEVNEFERVFDCVLGVAL